MIKNDNGTKNSEDEVKELEDLLVEAKNINAEIKNISEDFDAFTKKEESEIKEISQKTTDDLAGLDEEEKVASADLEKLMMENAEEIAKEEEEE